MNKYFSIVLAVLVLASCQNSGDRKASTPAPAAPITFSNSAAGSNKQGVNTSTPVTTTNSTAGVNPQHGAPGHRCDIPVGASLNSAAGSAPVAVPNSNPASMAVPNSNPAPIVLKPNAAPQPVNKNVRLNPAHGAPGHDCSIPVGQPLKS